MTCTSVRRLPVSRRRLWPVIITILALSARLGSQAPGGPQPPRVLLPPEAQQEIAAGGEVQVIVGVALNATFRPENTMPGARAQAQRVSVAQAQDAVISELAAAGVPRAERFRTIPFVSTRVNATTLAALQQSPLVTTIEEDRLLTPTLAESIPIVGANVAWSRGFSGAAWTVAVLDTGVDKAHPFLAGKVVSEACYSNANGGGFGVSLCPGGATATTAAGSGVPCTLADCSHGTHTAGIAAGKGASFSGVARDASIIAIQVFTDFSGDAGAYQSDVIRGLERVYALRNTYNIASVNMSLGGGRYFSYCDAQYPATKTAIDNLRSAGIATVVSSGNDGYVDSLSSPACISTAISVGSTDDGSFGTTVDEVSWFTNSAAILNLLAPGQWINSSIPGGTFVNYRGTSMAAPHVAGAWAVLKQERPSATVASILSALTTSATVIRDPGNNLFFPRINVAGALSSLCSYSVSPTAASAPAYSTSSTVTVTATDGCIWTATPGASWLTIAGGSSGTGNGTTTYAVATNTGPARVGTLTVAGVTVSVEQAGAHLFTDDPLSTNTAIRAIHIAELRGRINDLRVSHGLAVFSWTDPAIAAGVTVVKATHLRELRAALGEVYAAARLASPTYTDTSPVSGVTPIRRVHIAELRDAVKALE